MSHDPRDTDDKFENHYRQQLSALVDGELAPDEARFLLRRLQHDDELSGRFERWQLCGDVLRGQVSRVVAADFSARVAAAIAAPAPAGEALPPMAAAGGRRLALTRWGGGAALAASVAAVAMLVGRQAAPDPAGMPAPAVAVQTLPSTDAVLVASAPAPAAAPAAAVPASPSQATRAAAPPRVQRESLGDVAVASASTGTGRAPAQAAAAAAAPVFVALADTQVAAAAMPALSPADPFASSAPLQARPWPRAVLPQPSGSGYTANLGGQGQARAFYPFEPSLPAQPPASDGSDRAAPNGSDRGELPAPPDDDGQR
ncbi:sigma-E factor negative regulatory protein [Pseudoxanthomonas suwonensis]|uniref:sigma-E factor negative regulatory protein n=1 Tax=Pseudoxanthomonas suwonensis TaxID=314722 RepID=UPI00069725AE|nr:sigma-E factor negative regulatory protein [Pseudoxanthomonas suwonensis]